MKEVCIIILLFLCVPLIGQDNPFPVGKKYAYRYNDNTIITQAARSPGITYKVKVMRIPFFNENDPGLVQLKKYGDLYIEYWKESDIYVLLIGTFQSIKEAQSVARQLQNIGFRNAEMIKYQDGLRP